MKNRCLALNDHSLNMNRFLGLSGLTDFFVNFKADFSENPKIEVKLNIARRKWVPGRMELKMGTLLEVASSHCCGTDCGFTFSDD